MFPKRHIFSKFPPKVFCKVGSHFITKRWQKATSKRCLDSAYDYLTRVHLPLSYGTAKIINSKWTQNSMNTKTTFLRIKRLNIMQQLISYFWKFLFLYFIWNGVRSMSSGYGFGCSVQEMGALSIYIQSLFFSAGTRCLHGMRGGGEWGEIRKKKKELGRENKNKGKDFCIMKYFF